MFQICLDLVGHFVTYYDSARNFESRKVDLTHLSFFRVFRGNCIKIKRHKKIWCLFRIAHGKLHRSVSSHGQNNRCVTFAKCSKSVPWRDVKNSKGKFSTTRERTENSAVFRYSLFAGIILVEFSAKNWVEPRRFDTYQSLLSIWTSWTIPSLQYDGYSHLANLGTLSFRMRLSTFIHHSSRQQRLNQTKHEFLNCLLFLRIRQFSRGVRYRSSIFSWIVI